MENVFFIVIEYQGSEFIIEIENPYLPISDIIKKLLEGLDIPRFNSDGYPYEYHLGRVAGDEEQVLYPKQRGEEKTLLDYGVQSGDFITLTIVPHAAIKYNYNKN